MVGLPYFGNNLWLEELIWCDGYCVTLSHILHVLMYVRRRHTVIITLNNFFLWIDILCIIFFCCRLGYMGVSPLWIVSKEEVNILVYLISRNQFNNLSVPILLSSFLWGAKKVLSTLTVQTLIDATFQVYPLLI